MTSPGHSPVSLLVDQFKPYDLAVREWLVKLGPLLNTPTFNVVFATPDRAFATLGKLLEKRYGDRADKIKLAPYPLASISRLSHTLDRERMVTRLQPFRGRRYTADKRVMYDALFPLPWDMTYQIDFWAKTREPANLFMAWIQGEATPQGVLTVDMTPIDAAWGSKVVMFDVAEVTDNSVLEAEEENRALRYSVTLTVHGWVLLPLKANKTIFDAIAEQVLADPGTSAAEIDADPVAYPVVSTEIVRLDENLTA